MRHPASGYVQGMNDLLAVFLVVLVDEVSEGDHVDVATLSDGVLDDVAADAYGLLNGVLESLAVWKSTSASGAPYFLGDDAAVVARSSGEEPASPRHRASVASMAWRTTRRFNQGFSPNAP